MYDSGFYEEVRDGAARSAAAVVPMLVDTFKPTTVIDVGCGEGWWGYQFALHGCTVTGVDGHAEATVLPAGYLRHDLRTDLPSLGRYDLAVCLEVAEHLPPERAPGLIADLCDLADTVVFSAAIPGQGGTGHVNEQWPEYWCTKFGQHDYAVSGALRWLIWSDDRVENWYRQNLLVATKTPGRWPDLFTGLGFVPVAVVHPILFDARRTQ